MGGTGWAYEIFLFFLGKITQSREILDSRRISEASGFSVDWIERHRRSHLDSDLVSFDSSYNFFNPGLPPLK